MLCVWLLVPAAAIGQAPQSIVAVTGELTANETSRSVARMVGVLLTRASRSLRVIPADTVASFMDREMSYHPGIPATPVDLSMICERFGAASLVDVVVSGSRGTYRALVFRPLEIELSSPRGTRHAFALAYVGSASARSLGAVATELLPVIESYLQGERDGVGRSPRGSRCGRPVSPS
jgi:hypothetical protein